MLADQVLESRLEQRSHSQAQQATAAAKPAATDAGVKHASLTGSCPACLLDTGSPLPWPVLLGFASMLLSIAVAATLTSSIRAHSGLVEEIGHRRKPLLRMTRADPVSELSTDLAATNQLMAELNHIASLIKRAAGDNAHALRSPLSVVKIAIRRVRAQTPADETMVNAALDAAEANVDRMSDIVDASQRLDEETATLILAPRRTEDLAEIVRDALQRCARRPEAMSLQFSSRLQGRVFVNASEGMLEALLDDLLRNAAAASPQRAQICVQLVAHDHTAVLRMDDHGSWVSADVLDSVLERDYTQFNQLPTTRLHDAPRLRRRSYYVANRNAELLGGQLWFDNRPDGGMSVVVRLPLA